RGGGYPESVVGVTVARGLLVTLALAVLVALGLAVRGALGFAAARVVVVGVVGRRAMSVPVVLGRAGLVVGRARRDRRHCAAVLAPLQTLVTRDRRHFLAVILRLTRNG